MFFSVTKTSDIRNNITVNTYSTNCQYHKQLIASPVMNELDNCLPAKNVFLSKDILHNGYA